MRKSYLQNGFIRYEKSESEKRLEALFRLAKIQTEALTDAQALTVPELFETLQEGKLYQPGTRVRGKDGKLYKVKKAHKGGKSEKMEEEVYINLNETVAQAETGA